MPRSSGPPIGFVSGPAIGGGSSAPRRRRSTRCPSGRTTCCTWRDRSTPTPPGCATSTGGGGGGPAGWSSACSTARRERILAVLAVERHRGREGNGCHAGGEDGPRCAGCPGQPPDRGADAPGGAGGLRPVQRAGQPRRDGVGDRVVVPWARV